MAIKELTCNLEFIGNPYSWEETDSNWSDVDLTWASMYNLDGIIMLDVFKIHKGIRFKADLIVVKRINYNGLQTIKQVKPELPVIRET